MMMMAIPLKPIGCAIHDLFIGGSGSSDHDDASFMVVNICICVC